MLQDVFLLIGNSTLKFETRAPRPSMISPFSREEEGETALAN